MLFLEEFDPYIHIGYYRKAAQKDGLKANRRASAHLLLLLLDGR